MPAITHRRASRVAVVTDPPKRRSATPLATIARRWQWRVLAGLTLITSGVLLDELFSGALPGDWRLELGLGVLLLAAAGAIGLILVRRSWRDVGDAQQMLELAISNLVRAYDSLVQTNRTLRETADARDRANNQLRTAVRERDAFLAAVSHDLKTPLTVIKGHADLMRSHLNESAALDRARIANGLERVTTSAARVTTLVDQLLWLAHLEMDQAVDLERAPTDLVDLARRTVTEYALTTNLHRLVFTPAVSELEGQWDRARIESAVANLVSNSIKYSPDGGEVRVEVSPDERGLAAVLRVTDDGLGIPPADLPHIFDHFYRARNVGDQIVGTGMGLSGVRHTVEAHGGTIEVESREGAGSTFTMRLPIESVRDIAPEPMQ